MAVSSGGGHWVELLRLAPAYADADLAFVTVVPDYRSQMAVFPGSRFYTVVDVTRWNKLKWIVCVLQLLVIMLRERPRVIVATGALPAYFACRIGKVLGAKVAWIDSIANVEELSRSGEKIGTHADLWLTQWPHLAKGDAPGYRGAVL